MTSTPTSSTQVHSDGFLLARSLQRSSGVLIVDDHELVRLGLRALLASRLAHHGAQPQILEVRSLASALEVYALNRDSIAVVFLDLNLPDAQGVAGLAQFLRRFPHARVAVLSGAADPETIERAVSMGADAFLRKSSDLDDVVAYLESRNIFPSAAPRSEAAPMAGLTQRQVQILGLVLQGKTNREIAETTCLVEGTVKNHVSAILLHFGARSRAQLISALRSDTA